MKLRIALTGVLGTALVGIASLLSYGLDYFCLNDTTSRTNTYCQEGGAAHVVIPRLLILFGLPLLTAWAAVTAAKRRRYWPVLLATVLCVPLTVLLPKLVIPKEISRPSADTPPALRALSARVLTARELVGFTHTGIVASGINAASWVEDEELPPIQTAKEATRLEHLGFVGAVRELLAPVNGGLAEGLSIVEQFRSPRAAGTELAAQLMMGKTHRAGAFTVPSIPGAGGFGGLSGQTTGYNVAFADGSYYYLVGAGFSRGAANAPTQADVVAAAQHLYRRVHR